MLYNEDFKKASIKEIIKHKIKWIVKILWLCLNLLFDLIYRRKR
nr:MAG TPA: hypothetical protein [Caudoviricetes sp.]